MSLRATGADDPALAETLWPMPDHGVPGERQSIEWVLRYGQPSRGDMLVAAGVLAAYQALIEDGTTAQQLKRLAALRRVHRRRSRR